MVRFRSYGWILILILIAVLWQGQRYMENKLFNSQAAVLSENVHEIERQLNLAMNAYFQTHRQVPVAGQVALPAPPQSALVDSWALQPNGVVDVTLALKTGGRAVRMQAVPRVQARMSGLRYDLTADLDTLGRLKMLHLMELHGDLKTSADIPARLAENAARLQDRTGRDAQARAGVEQGTVLQLPDGQVPCGSECLLTISCVTPRPLLCVDNSNSTRIQITINSYPGNHFARLQDADQACRDQIGSAYRLASSSLALINKISLMQQLPGGQQVWLHHDRFLSTANCWLN